MSQPAVIRNKALITPSTCTVHPKYQGKRKPTSKDIYCTCAWIYDSMRDPAQRLDRG